MLSSEQYIVPLLVVEGKEGFVPTAAACGDGFIHLYQSLDGVKISHSGRTLTQDIEQKLRTILEKAIVIERGPKLDKEGRIIGERAVIVYENKDTGRQSALAYSTSGDSISMISGSSLEHVMSFEKRYQRKAAIW
jgi:hypothetical protein